MAINKKLIHFNKKTTFNSQKLSANASNTQYQVGGTGTVQTGAPDINYQSIVYIKDSKEIWTHGQFYATAVTWSTITGKPSFATVATSGNYNDLSNKPTIPTKLPTPNVLTFTGYQSKSYNGSAAVSVAIPSRVSDLTNDSGYITSYTDTKNTTGSTNSSSKLYLVGATSQASSPVTYSNSGVYTQSGAVYASAGFYDTSDMRVKDNIESIDVSKADKIRLVEFDRTDREHHGYGVIAQELETVYPSMVNTDENGFKTVNYSEIYAVKIKYLEDKIAALEAVVDKLISK